MSEEELEPFKLGPTGEHPKGKLHETDEGEIRLGVASYKGNVVINFATPVAWLAMTPAEAIQFAEVVKNCAVNMKTPEK